MTRRIKRLADALGPQSDYSFDMSFPAGAQSRTGRRRLRDLVTRQQRRKDKQMWLEDNQ